MGSGGVAIADPPTVMRLKVPFSDGLGGRTAGGLVGQFSSLSIILVAKIRKSNTEIENFFRQSLDKADC